MFYRSLFVLLSFFAWPLFCLFFFDIRPLITLWYLLVIVLSVLLRYTASDYPLISFGHCFVCSSSIYGLWLPFGILKHFYTKQELLLLRNGLGSLPFSFGVVGVVLFVALLCLVCLVSPECPFVIAPTVFSNLYLSKNVIVIKILNKIIENCRHHPFNDFRLNCIFLVEIPTLVSLFLNISVTVDYDRTNKYTTACFARR